MRSRTSGDDARAETFREFVDGRAIDAAYHYATLILGDRAEAEDATHDAALAAWRHFSELRDPQRFEAWFGRILVNTCRDRLRKRRWTVPLPDSPDAMGWVADPTEAVIRRQALSQALQTLNPEQREVIVLRYYADLTVEQIAQRTGAGVGTVKSRLHYARHHLQTALGWGFEETDHGR